MGRVEVPARPGSIRFVGGGVADLPAVDVAVGVGAADCEIVAVATAESTTASLKAA